MSKMKIKKSGRNAKIYIGLGVLILGIVLIGMVLILKYTLKSEDKTSTASLIEIIEAEIIPTGWVGEEGEWYYVNETTYEKESGWLEVDGEKYYLDPTTKIRQSGIVEIPGEGWFYFDEEGRLQKDGIVNNHVLDKEGKIERILLNEEDLEARNQELKPFIDEIYKKHGAISGAVALIEGGVVTDTWEYGDAVRNSVPMTEDTKMRVASISKVVVAMNAFRMVDEGIISLDETIGTYWGTPVYNSRYPDDPITFRSILSHTSSIAELSGYTNMEQKIKGNGIFRNVKPGDPSSYSYCNFGFCVGGVTLEKAANKTIYDISEEYFFGPMGIDASFAAGRLDHPELLADLYYADRSLARSRDKMAGMTGSDVPGYDGSFFPGGLCISAKDLAKVISILVNDGMYEGQRYLSEESVATMESEYGPADYHGVQVTQCLPLKYQTNMYGEEGLYFHSGSAYGAFNLASYNPETRSGVIVLSIGASGACDEYGAYAVCGDISELLYQETNKLMYENVVVSQKAEESENTDVESSDVKISTDETDVTITEDSNIEETNN